MKAIFRCSLAIIFCIGLTTAADAKDEWMKVRSQNFTLIGNASEKEIHRVATKLEQFREVFRTLFPNMNFSSPVRTTVIVFKNDKSFGPYKPVRADGKITEWTAGYFLNGEDVNYIVLSAEGERQQTYQTIFHEYTHLLVNDSFGRSRIPPWFNEGLAEYYDQFSIENDQKVKLGGLNEHHLYLLSRTDLIPFDRFFNIDYYSLHQQGDHSASIFYAQSWALMHYLIHANRGIRRPQINKFLTTVLKGVKPIDAFRTAFNTDYATMESELKNYVARRSFMATVVLLKEKLVFDSGMSTAPVTDGEAKAHLGDLLLKADRLDIAEAHLKEALGADPDSAFANSTLGMLKMKKRNFPEAKKYLEKAVNHTGSDYLAYFRYGYVLSREAMDSDNRVSYYPDETAIKIRDALATSILMNPRFPESYKLLAFVSIVRNDKIDEAIGYINKALELSPGNQEYQLNLATLYARRQEFDRAQSIASAVFKSAEDPETRTRAQNVEENIRTLREQTERLKDSGKANSSGTFSDVSEGAPPSEEELAKRSAAAQRESIKAALRTAKQGEKRILAYLSRIDCARGTITFIVKAGDQILRLHSKDFQGLNLMTFVPARGLQIGCETIKKDLYAVITYVPAQDTKQPTAGEVVSIELVPETFGFDEEIGSK